MLFDDDIRLDRQGQSAFTAEVADNWSINGNPNGGYVTALLAKAMSLQSEKRQTPVVTVSFLAKTIPGEAGLYVENVAESKQFNRLQVKLIQDGVEKCRASGIFAVQTDECFIERHESGPPEMADLDQCVQIPPLMQGYTLYDHMDVRLDPACAGWMQGKLAKISEHKGWIRFADDRPHDHFSILLMADAFPPPVFSSQGLVAWVPTLELSVDIHNIPKTRWLKCIFRTRHISCGLLEENGELWDEDGRLVALCRQIAQFRKIS